MTSGKPAAVSARILDLGWVQAIRGYLTQIQAVAAAEISKLRHDPGELATRALQPAIWLLLFGQVMAQVRGLQADGGRYLDFLAPGILAQSVLFAAIFYGIAAIWERDLGVLHRYMVSPAPRSAIVLGKMSPMLVMVTEPALPIIAWLSAKMSPARTCQSRGDVAGAGDRDVAGISRH